MCQVLRQIYPYNTDMNKYQSHSYKFLLQYYNFIFMVLSSIENDVSYILYLRGNAEQCFGEICFLKVVDIGHNES